LKEYISIDGPFRPCEFPNMMWLVSFSHVTSYHALETFEARQHDRCILMNVSSFATSVQKYQYDDPSKPGRVLYLRKYSIWPPKTM